MKTIQLPGIPRPVSQICLGTAYLGSREDEQTSFAILDAYFERGGRFLNTAHEYGYGRSERTVGKWIRERGVRDQIVLTSKCGEDSQKSDCRAMSPEELFEDIDETLGRTGLDYVDFYLLHIDDERIPAGEIVDALNEMRNQGKILHYGCSNWACRRILEAFEWSDAHDLPRFAVNEIEMNLAFLNRLPEVMCKWMNDEFIAFHQSSGMAVGAYSPICNGLLTKYLRDGDTRAWNEWQIRTYAGERTMNRARRIGKLARETGYAPTQLQLAWVLAQPYGFPVFPILGARTVDQLTDSLTALDCTLTQDMIDYLTGEEA